MLEGVTEQLATKERVGTMKPTVGQINKERLEAGETTTTIEVEFFDRDLELIDALAEVAGMSRQNWIRLASTLPEAAERAWNDGRPNHREFLTPRADATNGRAA